MHGSYKTLFAGILVQIVLGGIYAWSSFLPLLVDSWNFTYGQSGIIFGTTILVFTLTMIYAGHLLSQKGPGIVCLIAAFFYTTGFLIAGLSGGSFIVTFLGIGVFVGAGIGFGYVCPISLNIKWFPEQKGLVTGVAVAGFGAGAIILSWLVNFLDTQGFELAWIFILTALLGGFVLVAGSVMMTEPSREKSDKDQHKINYYRILFSTKFFMLFYGMFAGTFAGLMIVGNLVSIGIDYNLAHAHALFAVSVFAAGNTTGRLLWGYFYDRFSVMCILFSQLVLLLSLIVLANITGYITFFLASFLCGFGFGGCFCVYAAAMVDEYDEKLFTKLYPVCFVGYGIAGLMAPSAAGFVADKTGSYKIAIIVSILLIASYVVFFLKNRKCLKSVRKLIIEEPLKV